MNRERLAIGLPSKASSSAGVVGGDSLEAVAGVGDEEMGEDRIGGDIEEPVVENGEESEPLWLAWPFQVKKFYEVFSCPHRDTILANGRVVHFKSICSYELLLSIASCGEREQLVTFRGR